MNEFEDKVVLITGAGRGIGREIALAFASSGMSVAANDINPLGLDETVNQILQVDRTAHPYVFDIAKRMPIEGLVTQVLDHFRRIDFLVNCASVEPDASLLEMDEWEFHRTLDVNLGGPFFCMQQVGRIMQQQRGGSIINLISWVGWDHFHKGHAALLASQAGLLGLTQAAAGELAAHHIRVNAVCHGSPMMGAIHSTIQTPAGLLTWKESLPQICTGDHPELVSLALFLCSQSAESLSGQIICVNNG